MTNKDLMVGDWIKLHYDINYKTGESLYTNVRITGINEDGTVDVSMQDGDGWDLKLIYPIQLTPEILEKNGFENIDNMYPFPTFRCDDKENYFCITIGFPEGNKTRRKYPFIEINGENIFVEYIIINFIHELQHVLKLCGIDKNIEL